MKQLSSMDLYFLTKEFKILENQRIDNFYYENETFYLRIYVSGKGHFLLTNKIGKYIYLGTEKEETTHPSSFIQHLRKYLRGGFIREINQIDSERILNIKIEKMINDKLQIFYLFIEIFAPGNIIITNSNLEIMNSLQKKKFKDRKVIVREKYELPPQKKITPFKLDKEKIIDELLESDLSIVKFLAMKLGIGGKFSEEICFLANVDKNKPAKEFDGKELTQIIKTIKEIIDKPTEGHEILNDENQIIDFVPFKFKNITKNQRKKNNFNDTLKEYFKGFKEENDKKKDNLTKELKKLENRLKKQQEQMKSIEIEYEKFNSLGNIVYENYSIVEELLVSINKAAKEKGWNYVLERIKNDEKLSKIIKKLNYKNNEIELEL